MTSDEAKRILSGKLIFGDAQQIEALRLLNGPKDASDDEESAEDTCKRCEGEGTVAVKCDACDGIGFVSEECPICSGEGTVTK